MLAFTTYTFGSALGLLLLVVYLFMPALWLSMMAMDDSSDAHESALGYVASRNPFRTDAEPANMAKLILLRQKIQSNNRRRRSGSYSRQATRSYPIIPITTKPRSPWVRFGKSFGKQYHY